VGEDRFAIRQETLHDGGLVVLRGDIDLNTAPQLKAALVQALASGPRRLVVDLRQVAALDSSGLAALVAAHRRLAQTGGTLDIVVGDRGTALKFKVTGLDQLMRIWSAPPPTAAPSPVAVPPR
jgi:anti-sigma B factor antagonist